MAILDNPRKIVSFRRLLLGWYDKNRRNLPWRHTSDPYAIWLSEIMLQQTTVRTVMSRWQAFLDRWPTVNDLARAPLDDVLHEWSGLGYYARARNLHRAAGVIRKEFGGRLPERFELLLALPGMGPYTAAAVASIAFNEPVAVVDANVERVLARLFVVEEDIKSTAGKRRLKMLADALVDPRRPGDFNQAMMELGAMVCLPKEAHCEVCPLSKHCFAFQREVQLDYPKMPKKEPLSQVREAAVYISHDGKFLVLKRPDGVSLAGMWELPRVRCEEDETSEAAAKRAARELSGFNVRLGAPVAVVRHTVMRDRITLTVYPAKSARGTLTLEGHTEARWITLEEWKDLPRSSSQKRVAQILSGEGKKPKGAPEETDHPDLFR